VPEFRLDVQAGYELPDELSEPDVITAVLPYRPAEERSALDLLSRVQDLTDLLGSGCTALVLGPADVLSGPLPAYGEAERLRTDLLRGGLVEAVVTLPGGVLPFRPAHATAVWTLTRDPEPRARGRVLLADLSGSELTPDLLMVTAEDVLIWRAEGWHPGGHEPAHGLIASVAELTAQAGAALVPRRLSAAARWTGTVTERPLRITELELRIAELAAGQGSDAGADGTAGSEAAQVLRVHAALRDGDAPGGDGNRAGGPGARPERVSVRELVRQRRLRLLPGHRFAAPDLGPVGDHTVLTPQEVTGAARPGSRRIDRAVLLTRYERASFTEPGDVVVTAVPRFGALVDEDGFHVVAFPARVLRVRRDAERPLRPRVLAELLRAAAQAHPRAGGAVRAGRGLEDIEIPDLDPDEAARFDVLLARIARREAHLREYAAALEELRRITAAGLADGTLTLRAPPPATDRRAAPAVP
jgi:hypothetical protein